MLQYYEKHYVYVTPNVLSGLLTSKYTYTKPQFRNPAMCLHNWIVLCCTTAAHTVLLFFVIVYIGVGCLAALQTPSKFIHARIPEGKEF